MGATASRRRSSPSVAAKYSLTEMRSTTRLFQVADYSKCVMMPAGSVPVFKKLRLLDRSYIVQVYPAGYDKNAEEFVSVFVVPTIKQYKDPTRIFIEILHGSEEERTVFDNHTAGLSQAELANHAKGYFRFVKRKELEASGCVRNDRFTVRCTVSLDVMVTRSRAEVMKAMSAADALSSKPVVSSVSHTLVIDSFSKIKAALPAGECVHSTQFCLGGSSWYFKVYPNGHRDDDKVMSIFLGRGRSHERAMTAEFCFEIDDGTEEPWRPFTECMFDHNNPEHEFPYHVFNATDSDDDRLVLRCHLRVMK